MMENNNSNNGRPQGQPRKPKRKMGFNWLSLIYFALILGLLYF